jgi:hypothetical protein
LLKLNGTKCIEETIDEYRWQESSLCAFNYWYK